MFADIVRYCLGAENDLAIAAQILRNGRFRDGSYIMFPTVMDCLSLQTYLEILPF